LASIDYLYELLPLFQIEMETVGTSKFFLIRTRLNCEEPYLTDDPDEKRKLVLSLVLGIVFDFWKNTNECLWLAS
jgi:hypothetical protein